MRAAAVIATIKAPRFQLTLNVVALIASAALWVTAAAAGWLDKVAFVSHVSMAALVLASLGGVAAALVGTAADTGYTLNAADKKWLEQLIERKLGG